MLPWLLPNSDGQDLLSTLGRPVTRGRHSLASRNAQAQRRNLIAAPLVTCAVIGAGVALSAGGKDLDVARQAGASISNSTADRSVPVSRDAERKPVKPKVVARRWTTAKLDLRSEPNKSAPVAGEVKALHNLAVTGLHVNGFAQVKLKERIYWVTNDYLAIKKPTKASSLPILGKPCARGGGVESGLTNAAIRVYRAVCNNFPQITSYGGYDAHGEHSSGRAVDIMTSDVTLGNAIAEFLRANAGELNLYNIIWRQQIFTVERGGEGWRPMSSRGSATANHYDHVHVSVN